MSELSFDDVLEVLDEGQEEKPSLTVVSEPQEAPLEQPLAVDDVLGVINEDQTARIRSGVFQGVQEDPDSYARDKATAERVGLPVEAVRHDRQTVENRLKIEDVMGVLEDAPKTRRFMEDPHRAKLAHDDATNLSNLEKAWDWYTGVWGNMGRGLLGGIDLLQMRLYATTEAAGEASGIDGLTEFGREGRIRNEAERGAYGTRSSFTDIGGPAEFVEWLTTMIAEESPSMAPAVAGGAAGAAVGTSFVPGPGTIIGGLIGAFLPNYILGVGDIQSSIKEKDQNAEAPGVAFGAGLGVAALDSAIPGKLGSKIAKTFGFDPSDVAADVLVDVATKSVAKRVGAVSKKAILDSGGEAITEAIQEGLTEIAASYAVGQDIDVNQLTHAMIEGFAAGIFMGGTFGGATALVEDAVTTQRARAHREHVLGVLDKAKESVLRNRDPGAFKTYLESLQAEGGETVEVSPGPLVELLQSTGENPVTLFEEMGATEEDLTKALENGTDVSVPASDFFTVMADHQRRDDVLLNIRSSANAQTMAESEAFQENIKKKAEDLRKEYAETEETDPLKVVKSQAFDNAREIRETVTKKIGELRHIQNKRQAETNAVLYEGLYTVIADEAIKAKGADADVSIETLMPELAHLGFRSVAFDNRNEGIEGARVLEQEAINQFAHDFEVSPEQLAQELEEAGGDITQTPRFKKWFGDSKVVDENGEPLVVYHGTVGNIRSFKEGKGSNGISRGADFYFSDDAGIADTYTTGNRYWNILLNEEDHLRRKITDEEINADDDALIDALLDDGNYAGYQKLPDSHPLRKRQASVEQRIKDAPRGPAGGNIVPAYLSLQNPMEIDAGGRPYYNVDGNQRDINAIVKEAKEKGRDGVIIRNVVDTGNVEDVERVKSEGGKTTYVAFKPEQIKSVHNRGTFDANDPRILYQEQMRREKFDKDFARWKERLPGILDGSTEKGEGREAILGRTAPVLRAVGLDKRPLAIKDSKLRRIRRDRPETADKVIENLPELIADPLVVIPEKSGGYRVVLDAKDENGSYYMAVIEPSESKAGHPRNAVVSFYPLDPDYVVESGKNIHDQVMDAIRDQRFTYEREKGKSAANVRSQSPHVTRQGPETQSLKQRNIKLTTLSDIVNKYGSVFYQDGDNSPQGRIANLPDGRILVDAFEKADMSTVLHESGHLFVQIVERLASAEDASPRFKDIYQTFLGYTGAQTAEDLDVSIHGETARAKQEKLAEAFEKYLMEGKAPSTKLHEAFLMYKNWLVKIYDGIKRVLGVRLNDDIREAFDKMLATDAEIEAMAAVHSFLPNQNTAVLSVLTTSEREAWGTLTDLANDASANAKAARESAAKARSEADWWRKELENLTKDILSELYKQPEYQAFWYLTRGEMKEGPTIVKDLRISKAAIEDMGIDPKSLPKSKRAVYTTDPDKAADPDYIARMFGFEDGLDLIDSLTNLQKAEDNAAERAREQMIEKHGDMTTPDDIKVLMEEAAYNADRAASIQLELDALARRTGQDKVARPVIKAAVAKLLDELPLRDVLSPQKHLSASIRAAKAAERAAASRNWQKAFTEKRKHLLNHELYRETLKAKEEVEGGIRYMRKFSRRGKNFKNHDAGYIDRIKELTSAYGLGPELSITKRARLEKEAFLDFMEDAQRHDGAIFTFPQEVLDADEKTHYRDLSLLDFRALRDTVKNLDTQARLKKEGINAEEKARIEELAMRASLRMADMDASHASKTLETQQSFGVIDEALNKLKYADAGLTKTEFLLELLDGGGHGVFFEAAFKPFVDAEYQENILVRENSERFHKAFDALPNGVKKKLNKRENITELGIKMTRSELIALALNVGNESNLEKVVNGSKPNPKGDPKMSEEAIMMALINRLSKEEWDFVQETWDIFQDMYPQVEEVFRKENGRSPEAIEAKPIKTPYGEYRGGYFPMMYDPKRSADARDIEKKSALEEMQSEAVRATVFSGMTKERTSFSAPVLFDLTKVAGALHSSAHFITHYDAVRAVNKFLGHPDVRKGIVDKLGNEYYDLLTSWVGQIATGGRDARVPFGVVDDIVEHLRGNMTVAAMGGLVGGSVTTLLSQPLGLFTSMDALSRGVDPKTEKYRPDLGPLRLLKGLATMLNPGAVKSAWAKSKELRFRLDNADRDIRHVNTKLQGVKGAKAQIQRAMLIGIPALQLVAVDTPTWIAAYNMALKGNMSEEQAIDFADALVRKSQGSGSVKDLSPLLATRGTARGLTMFMTFFNTLYGIQQRFAREAKMDVNTLNKAVFGSLFLFVLPSLVEGIFRMDTPNEDDEKSVIEWLALRSLLMALSSVPVVRDVVSAAESGFGYKASPIESPVGQGLAAAQDILNEDRDIDEKTLTAALSALGLTTGVVPSAFLNRIIKTLNKIDDGEDWLVWEFFVGPKKD